MKAISIFYLAGCTLLASLCSCSNTLDRQSFIKWVRDDHNGLHATKEVGELVYDVQFNPAAYTWLQRTGGKAIEEKEYQAAMQELDSMQLYTLTIGVKGNADFIDYQVQDMSEKQRKLYYFSYLFQQDIQLEEDGQLFPCVLFHFERPADLKNSRTFVLGFANPHKQAKEAKLVIHSDVLNSLPIKIKVSKDNIPSLRI